MLGCLAFLASIETVWWLPAAEIVAAANILDFDQYLKTAASVVQTHDKNAKMVAP
jgi:hypothetical protein